MRFGVVEEVVELNGVQHTGYGICYTDEKSVCHKIPDITTDVEAINRFVQALNELTPDISQLEYLIEDFCIAQNCFT